MKICTSFATAFMIAASGLATAQADTSIVNENFDGYANQDAFEATWRPDNGDGIPDFLDPIDAGFLLPENSFLGTPPNDNPPGTQGQAILNLGTGVNEWRSANPEPNPNAGSFSLMPSATQWVKFGGDIYNDGPGINDSPSGMRQSIALRNDNYDRDAGTIGCQCGVNFIELGFYNTSAVDPRTGQTISSRQFQYRLALFSQLAPPDNVTLPNWLSFQFDPALDKPEFDAGDGDYNDNGIIGADDYVAWRKAGPSDTLPNDPTPGTVDETDYDTFKTNFGDGGPNGIVDINDIDNIDDTAEPGVGDGWHRFSALVKPNSITLEVDLYRDGINNATGQPGVDVSTTHLAQMNTAAGVAGAFNSLRIGPPSGISGNDQTAFDNVFLTIVDAPVGSSNGAVPEPASLGLVAIGMLGALGAFRRFPR